MKYISTMHLVNLFRGFAFFCNFVRNRIYVKKIKILGSLFLARNHKFDFGSKSSIFGNLKRNHIFVNHSPHFLPEVNPRVENHGHSFSTPVAYPVVK